MLAHLKNSIWAYIMTIEKQAQSYDDRVNRNSEILNERVGFLLACFVFKVVNFGRRL